MDAVVAVMLGAHRQRILSVHRMDDEMHVRLPTGRSVVGPRRA
jgi:hypothetical protein